MERNPNRNIGNCLNKEELLDTAIWWFVSNIGAVDKTWYRQLFQRQRIRPYWQWRVNMLLFRLLISAMFHSTGAKPLPGVKDGSSEWTRSRLDSNKVETYECSHLDEDKSSPGSDRKDFAKTKESLCGILFYCYVFWLFFFGSNAPAA